MSHLLQRLQDLRYRKRNLDEFNVSEVLKWYNDLKIYEDAINELEEKIRNLGDPKSQQESLEQEIARIESEIDHLKPYVTKYIQAQSILKREGLKSVPELEVHVNQLKKHKLMIDKEFTDLDEKVNRLEEEMERLSYNERIHQEKNASLNDLLIH